MKLLRSLVCALVLLFAAAPGAALDGRASPAEFREDMERRIQAAVPDARLGGEDPMVIRISGSALDGLQLNLHRIFDYCRTAAVEACEAEKQHFVAVMTSPALAAPALGAENLRVIVRQTQYVDSLRSAHAGSPMAAQPFPFIVRQIGDDLFAIMVFDAPTTMQMARAEDVAATGLDAAQAWTVAVEQTLGSLPRLPADGALTDAALVFETREYGGSLLLAGTEWDRLRRHYGADMFVTVVSDQFVFVGAIADGPDLTEFAGAVRDDCAAQPRCISPGIYRWMNSRWQRAR